MNPFLLMFFGLINHTDTLTSDAAKLYATIAHGEGGAAKVAAALTATAKLLTDTAESAAGMMPSSTAATV